MEVLKLLIWQLETQKMLQPLTPSPPHVTNNGKHVQIIKILGGKNIKLGWGIYTPGGNFQNYEESPKPEVGLVILMVIKCFLSNL